MEQVTLGVSEFVAVLNQTLEFAYPFVQIEGELANFRISKNRWVYFDIKDEQSTVRCFGTVYMLPGPLEDGMMIKIAASPRLHPQYNFSLNIQSISPVGQGSIKKAQALLEAKLTKEGLFDQERKRQLLYPPTRIGLIVSGQSAAYKDFVKVLHARWGGIDIVHADVQVQGEAAVSQVITAIEHMNVNEDVDIIVVTRGGGSPEDLAVFSTEQVTRAVAASRTPTLVAIGHEVDISLAELASDKRASTPSNAAELLVPDRTYELERIEADKFRLSDLLTRFVDDSLKEVQQAKTELTATVDSVLQDEKRQLLAKQDILHAYDPNQALKRGYAIARHNSAIIRSVSQVKKNDSLRLTLSDGTADVTITSIKKISR